MKLKKKIYILQLKDQDLMAAREGINIKKQREREEKIVEKENKPKNVNYYEL